MTRTARSGGRVAGHSSEFVTALIALIVLYFSAIDRVRGDSDPGDWLMKLNDAAQSLTYKGVFVFLQNDRLDAMEVTHINRDGVVEERVYSLNGSAREIIRKESMVWCYLPDQKVGIHEYQQVSDRSFPGILPERIDKLSQNYHIKLLGEERIAGRPSQKLTIQPRDKYRYGYDLWIDVEHGIVLKADLISISGHALEQYMFVHLEVDDDLKNISLHSQTRKEDLAWYGDTTPVEQSAPTGPEWTVEMVPEGFVKSRRIRRKSPMAAMPVEHFVYTDGLATVSVFIEKMGDSQDAVDEGASTMGALHAYGRSIDGFYVTVVGEVPEKTVTLMAKSIYR